MTKQVQIGREKLLLSEIYSELQQQIQELEQQKRMVLKAMGVLDEGNLIEDENLFLFGEIRKIKQKFKK